MSATPLPQSNTEPSTLQAFLESAPLHSPREVRQLFDQPEYGNVDFPKEIRVHCDHENCEGVRRHHFSGRDHFHSGALYVFAAYVCSNCQITRQIFFFMTPWDGAKHSKRAGVCTKVYQDPAFGHPIPKRLFRIIGEANREHFLQARRAIARGLGIGAYAYYRRIIENTKFDLIGSVLEVATATNAPAAQVALLTQAQTETQFSKAIEMLRGVAAIPAILLIEGHNPLLLLHDLFSEGLHQLDNSECLKRAQEAEIILCEIADRMQIAVTQRKAVRAAISSIMHRETAKRGMA